MRLRDRVAIVTGAGRGLGRAHALALAAQGAAVIVNDRGGALDGSGNDARPADDVVAAIRALGGQAVASGHDVADWDQAAALVDFAVSSFGRLDVLVNNAGILRDRTLANMSEAEWDAVIRVHLKGHAAPARHALAYWRDQHKRGEAVSASVVHTSSASAFAGNVGQANYASAKLAVVALSSTIALEGARYGVRSNVVSPSARTRISEATIEDAPADGGFDVMAPDNVSPLIAWLAEAACPANAQVFHLIGREVLLMDIAAVAQRVRAPGRWSPEALDMALRGRMTPPHDINIFLKEQLL